MRFDIESQSSIVLPEVKIFIPSSGKDNRGEIWTVWEKENILPGYLSFNLCKFTRSDKNVLRGLHGCFNTWKYMSVPKGEVFFVVADVRPDSENYLKWDSYVLSDKNHKGVLVPPGFVNGHLCLSEECLYYYMMSFEGDYVEPQDQVVITWNDDRLKIPWPVTEPLLSDRDKLSNI
jgi:dTDP-4-dehydrorhamnose 3,5-epimerase